MSQSKSKFKINPCKSCKKNFKITDINNINQCCYDTLGAFEGVVSLNDFRNSPEAENCKECVLESIDSIGRDRCDMRLTAYPNWVQVPHYLPSFLEEEGDLEKAKDKCIEACKSNRYENECISNCKIDYDAVEVVENYKFNERDYSNESMIHKIFTNDYAYLLSVSVIIIIIVYILTMLFAGFIKPSSS